MHVQHYPPVAPPDPEEEVEDNLRRAYRANPPRGLPERLEELIERLRERHGAGQGFLPPRRNLPRAARR